MKALTIYQPWASLIMAGAKPFEFRRRPAPASIIGKPLVIHASVKPIDRDYVQDLLDRPEHHPRWKETGLVYALATPILQAALDSTTLADGTIAYGGDWKHGDLPWGCGLGTAVIGEAIEAHLIAALGDSDRIDHHQWAWPLSDVTAFPEPVPARGKQGFWPWNPGADLVTF